MCAIKCNISTNDFVMICSIYRLPSRIVETYVEKLGSMLVNILQHGNKIIVCEDVNMNIAERNKQTQTVTRI